MFFRVALPLADGSIGCLDYPMVRAVIASHDWPPFRKAVMESSRHFAKKGPTPLRRVFSRRVFCGAVKEPCRSANQISWLERVPELACAIMTREPLHSVAPGEDLLRLST